MAKVKFVTTDADGRFSFHKAEDASEIVVDARGYTTDDPGEIAYLDTALGVKRASSKSSDKEDD